MKRPHSNLVLYILFVLKKAGESGLHIGQIFLEVSQETGEKIPKSTVYKLVGKLRAEGLVQEISRDYTAIQILTAKGEALLRAEIEHLAKIVKKARRLLKEKGKKKEQGE
jgi:DNA-binding PadR family transcriptional regulator